MGRWEINAFDLNFFRFHIMLQVDGKQDLYNINKEKEQGL